MFGGVFVMIGLVKVDGVVVGFCAFCSGWLVVFIGEFSSQYVK